MRALGNQVSRELEGFNYLAEGLWQTSMYLSVLFLYPVTLLYNAIGVTTDEDSLLKWAFFRTELSGVFLTLAATNDFFQDKIAHR